METASVFQPTKQRLDYELEELLGNIKRATKVRYFVYGGFALFSVFQTVIQLFPIPWKVIALVLLLLVITAISDFLIKKTKLKNTVTGLSNLYLVFQIIEVSIIFGLLHLSSIISLAGGLIITAHLFVSYFSYTKTKYTLIMIIITIFGYIAVSALEYLGIVVYDDVYKIGVNLAQNRRVFITNITTNVPLIIIIFFTANYFSKKLKESFKKLIQKEKELQEAGAVLEIKVDARTQELRELSETLEEQVRERTKKLEEKMAELENFNKLAVGRELKMMELKNEIRQLKKQLNQN